MPKGATLTVSYPDAGQMRLNAPPDGSGDTAGLVMTGSGSLRQPPGRALHHPAQGACTAGDVQLSGVQEGGR